MKTSTKVILGAVAAVAAVVATRKAIGAYKVASPDSVTEYGSGVACSPVPEEVARALRDAHRTEYRRDPQIRSPLACY
ncbi:MAG: hypothetical protein WC613_04290 [Candidatus Aenigmatarchaeota archaeon]